jgi:hypothetical protein
MEDNFDKYFIFVSSDSEISGYEAYLNRIKQNKWPLYIKTKNLNLICVSSKVLFYIAGSHPKSKCFIASAIIDKINYINQSEVDPDNNLKEIIAYVSFANIENFKKPIFIKDYMDRLSFIAEDMKKYYGLYFQSGTCKIDEFSYKLITEVAKNEKKSI